MAASKLFRSLQKIVGEDKGIADEAQNFEQIGWMVFLKVYDVYELKWKAMDTNFVSIIPEPLRWRNWTKDEGLEGKALLDFVDGKLFPGLKALPVTPETHRRQALVKTVFEGLTQRMKDPALLRQALDTLNTVKLFDAGQYEAFCDDYEKFLREIQGVPGLGWAYTPPALMDFIAGRMPTLLAKGGQRLVATDLTGGVCGFLTAMIKKAKGKTADEKRTRMVRNRLYAAEKDPVAYLLGVTNLFLNGTDVPKVFHGSALGNPTEDTSVGRFHAVLVKPDFDGVEPDSIKKNFPPSMRSDRTVDLFVAMASYRLTPQGAAAAIVPDSFLSGVEPAQIAIKTRLLKELNLHTVVRLPQSVFAPYTSAPANILFFDNRMRTKKTWFYRLDMPQGYKHFTKMKPILSEHFANCEAWWRKRQELQDEGAETFKANAYAAEALVEEYGCNLDLCGFPGR